MSTAIKLQDITIHLVIESQVRAHRLCWTVVIVE